jgi:D-psicose/D-tagatose/L-ribulose 3-epimerase
MIQYGAHCYLFTDRWSDEAIPYLETAKELGTDVFEIAIGDDVMFTPEYTRRKAEEPGMVLTTGPGGAWPLECDLSSDDAHERRQGLEWHKRQIDTSAEIGAFAYTGAIYGHPGVVKRRIPPSDEDLRIAGGLHQLADYAEQQGVCIALEPMSHFRTHVVNTPQQLMRLITLADHENIKALLDTYHLVTEIRDYAKAIYTVSERLIGFHACENDRGVPGDGLVPWKTVFAALKDIDFEGYIMLETYNSSLNDFAFQRGIFLDVCPDAESFIREGFDFVRRHLRTA